MTSVLVVDDALFMRATLKKLLTEAGFQVVGEAENGELAVARYHTRRIRVILMHLRQLAAVHFPPPLLLARLALKAQH